jgi:hypothetical protein
MNSTSTEDISYRKYLPAQAYVGADGSQAASGVGVHST